MSSDRPTAAERGGAPSGQPGGRPSAAAGERDRWGSLYGETPPRETGIGAATIRAQRQFRRRLALTAVVGLALLGLVAYLVAPRWWWNPKAYGDHVGAGAYVDPTPSALRSDLDATLPTLEAFVQKERGLRFGAPPTVVYLPDAQFRAELDSHIAFEQRRYVGGATYDALGWHHTGETFNRLDLALSGSNVEGLYGDWDGIIYLRGKRLTPLATAQLTGLMTKALDDQTYNLAALYGPNAEQDQRAAFDALVAGDMRWVEQAWVRTRPASQQCGLDIALRLPGGPGCRSAAAVPTDPISAEIRFPDDFGLQFVSALRSGGGVKALDAAFDNPPRSSADIMSVAHYRLDRSFRVVDAPPHPGRLVDFGTLGAYTISLALVGGHPERLTPAGMVVGWRGDSFSTYVAGGRTCVVDTAVFDEPAQAQRFTKQVAAAGWSSAPATDPGGVGFRVCGGS